VGGYLALTERYRRILRNVPAVRPGVCRICHSGPNEDKTKEDRGYYPECRGCSLVAGDLGCDVEALTKIVPFSLAFKGEDQLYTAVTAHIRSNPPDDSVYWPPVLAAMIDRFYQAHVACLSRLAGGDFTLVTTVPKPRFNRPDAEPEHPTQGIAANIPSVRRLYHPVLEPGLAAGAMNETTAQKEGFTTTGPLRGHRVLLLDDLCVRGGYLQSAALALSRQGATAVVPLVIARLIDPTHNGANARIRKDASAEDFDFERCCLC
jgi:phosphoribosylpyrophosphate synthetase